MSGNAAHWAHWRKVFEARRGRPAPALLNDDPFVLGIPASVSRSLAIFQLGESGGGTIVRQAQQSLLPGLDANYAAAMALFVEEEHRHAELLACCVRALRGKLLRSNWTARLFVFARRLVGLRTKVTVLLAAEVVGLCYYRLLARRLPDCEIRATLHEIVADERTHLDFHCAFLRSQVRTPLQRFVFVWAWRCLMLAAATAALVDHAAALRDLGVSLHDLRQRWTVLRRGAENLVTQPMAGPQYRPVLMRQPPAEPPETGSTYNATAKKWQTPPRSTKACQMAWL